MTFDLDKLHRLVIEAEVAEAELGTRSAMRNDARAEVDAYRADVLSRTRWAADEPRRGLSLTDMAALPAQEIAEARLDILTLRRGAAAEARLAALTEQFAEHSQRVSALKVLVTRLQAWAGTQDGATGLATPSLNVRMNKGQPA
jgi:hypothetical protein